MANIAQVVDGELQYDYTDSSKKTTATGSDLGYDQFLQLLCAEMQYQDPLEPTSNTEYVAQLATFSQLEAMLSLQDTEKSNMANDLVGKTVIMKVESETTGKTTYVDGKVDYVMYQGDDILLSVNNQLYPITQLDTVADGDYYEAVGLAKSIENMLSMLPDVDYITAGHKEMVTQVTDIYDGMSTYQKQFVGEEVAQKLEEYRTRLNEVLAAAEAEAAEQQPEDEAEAETDPEGVQEEAMTEG